MEVKLASPHWVDTGNGATARAGGLHHVHGLKHRSAPITSNARSQKERNDHAQNERSDRGEERGFTQLAFARTCACAGWRGMPCRAMYALGCGTERAEWKG